MGWRDFQDAIVGRPRCIWAGLVRNGDFVFKIKSDFGVDGTIDIGSLMEFDDW